MSLLDQLKRLTWKRYGNTALKTLMEPRVALLAGLMIFILYGIGWDTVLRPSFDVLRVRDEALAKHRAELAKKQALQQHYVELNRQLRNMDITMLSIRSGNSATVIALDETAEIFRLAQGGKMAGRPWPTLPKPHDSRENVSLTPTGSVSLDLRKPPDSTKASDKTTQNASSELNPATSDGGPNSVPVERFDYDLKASGTYPALMDLLNELVTYPKLIQINQIQIVPNTTADAERPDAATYPDFPVKLDMLVSLSLFLYVDNAPASASRR